MKPPGKSDEFPLNRWIPLGLKCSSLRLRRKINDTAATRDTSAKIASINMYIIHRYIYITYIYM